MPRLKKHQHCLNCPDTKQSFRGCKALIIALGMRYIKSMLPHCLFLMHSRDKESGVGQGSTSEG